MVHQKRGSVALAYVGLIVLATVGLLGLSSISSLISGNLDARRAQKIDLAFDYDEIETVPPIPEAKNAWSIYANVPPLAVIDSPALLISVLDGTQPRSGLDDIDALVESIRPELGRYVTGSKLPFCEIRPDFSQRRLTEFDEIQKAALALSVMGVRKRDASYLTHAARLGKHLSQNPYVEAATAHAWVRLYVLKAMDRLEIYEPKTVAALGEWPNLRRALRGELVHDLGMMEARTMQRGFEFSDISRGGQLRGMWARNFPKFPTTDYESAGRYFEGFERSRSNSRSLRRFHRGGYAALAKLLDEAKDLDMKLARS